MKLDTLYKTATTGALLVWEVEVQDNKFRTHSGQVGGAITTTKWTTCERKNEGRANSTTDSEQALKEATSLWDKKQKREHYTSDRSAAEAGERKFEEPMLAQKFDDRKDKINWKQGVTLQVKLNGVRCMATKNGLFSRKGKRYVSAPHVEKALSSFFKEHPNMVLDGELFNPSLRQNLNKIISLVRKEDPTAAELQESKELVQFHIYDCFGIRNDGVDFNIEAYSNRMGLILDVVNAAASSAIWSVNNDKAFSAEEVEEFLKECEEAGHEGCMIRLEGPYEHKRSKYLLKHKSFMDEEFVIKGVVEGKGNLQGKVGVFQFVAKNGNAFDASPTGTHELWEQMWKEKDALIGTKATVKYKELTPVGANGSGGVPSFAKVVALRNYE